MNKEMRVAEIVPVNCLEKTADNQYHMCLAHLVKQNQDYAAFYRRMSDEGKFVLVDNGAAEGSQLLLEDLLECYSIIQPTEVVMPDSLCDKEDTLRKAAESYSVLADGPWRIMAVPQGRTFAEWKECAKELLSKYRIDCIGVSKFLEMETGDINVRCKAVEWLLLNYSEVEVHLLGCSEGPAIIKACKQYQNIRGCDSAFAYICTQAGVIINESTLRPEGEIDFLNGDDFAYLEENMKNFEKAIGVSDNGISDTWN